MGRPPPNSLHRLLSSLVHRNDGHAMFEQGLRLSFEAAAGLSLVGTARSLLSAAGLTDAGDLKQRYELPTGYWLFLPLQPGLTDNTEPVLPPLHAALILGLCGVSLYAPERPVVWSEARLARQLILVRPTTFYDDHS
jgi:hypothetical protein